MIKKIMLLLEQDDLEELVRAADYYYANKNHPLWLIYIKKRYYHVKHKREDKDESKTSQFN